MARLVPNTPRFDQEQTRAAIARIRGRARRLAKNKPSTFDWPALKKMRDQGRP